MEALFKWLLELFVIWFFITYFFFWIRNLFHWKPTHFVGYAQLRVCLVIHDPSKCLFLKENLFLPKPKAQEVTRTRLIQMYKVTHVLMQLSWEKLCLPSWLCWPGASPYQIRVQRKARRWLEQFCVTCNNKQCQWVRTRAGNEPSPSFKFHNHGEGPY